MTLPALTQQLASSAASHSDAIRNFAKVIECNVAGLKTKTGTDADALRVQTLRNIDHLERMMRRERARSLMPSMPSTD